MDRAGGVVLLVAGLVVLVLALPQTASASDSDERLFAILVDVVSGVSVIAGGMLLGLSARAASRRRRKESVRDSSRSSAAPSLTPRPTRQVSPAQRREGISQTNPEDTERK